MYKVLAALMLSLLLANCASMDTQTAYTSSGQKVEFITSKSPTFGAAPTTVAVMEERPHAGKLRPIGVTQGQAVETTALGAIGGGLSQGMGYGLAAKVFNTGASSMSGSPGSTNVGSIFIKNTAVGGGATATAH